jgi:hypothetical protein
MVYWEGSCERRWGTRPNLPVGAGSLHAVQEVLEDDDFVKDQPSRMDPFILFAARLEEAVNP